MADNVILTPQVLSKMTLVNLGNYLGVTRACNSTFAKEFANKKMKIGETYYQRKPQRFEVTSGLNYQPQAIQNVQTPLTVNQVQGVHFDMDDIEKTLSIDYIQEKYAEPAALALASTINAEMAQFIAQNTPFSVGTPGSTPTTRLTYMNARSILTKMGMPKGYKPTAIINSTMNDAYVDARAGDFNPSALLSEQYNSGMVAGSALGLNWEMDETLYVHTVGTYAGSPTVNGAQSAEGGNNATMTLVTQAWSSGASTLNKGDRFTIGSGTTGVYAVHPQTRQSKGILQQFVVQDTISDSSGAMSPVIFPAITPSGPYQNVTQAAPNGASINVIGASGTVTTQGIVMHKDAYAFVSVPFEVPRDGTGARVENFTDPDTGINISYVEAFDPIQRRNIFRLDTLWGPAKLYAAEFACAVYAAQ